MKSFASLLVCASFMSENHCSRTSNDQSPSRYQDARYGYSIEAPVFPEIPAGSTVVPVLFTGPSDEGFAPSVNVMIQKTAITLDEYVKLSKVQFDEAGLKVRSETRRKVSGREAVFWEYEGTLNDRELRWLSLAVVDTDRVYLITATLLSRQFASLEKQMNACLESLKLAVR